MVAARGPIAPAAGPACPHSLILSNLDVGCCDTRHGAAPYDAPVPDFVIQDWHLEPYDGDQAPTHVHHAGEEAFVCLAGDLEVTVGGERSTVPPGGFALVPRGSRTPWRHVAAVTSWRS